MRKKRLIAFSLMIGLSATFITLQTISSRPASAQDAKGKQDGFITGCSETVIDALDECMQKRFSNVDKLFGLDRVRPSMLHMDYFLAETQSEREAISELEKGGWQVAFYLVGRRILGPKPDLTKPDRTYLDFYPAIKGPIAITPCIVFDDHGRAWDYNAGPTTINSSITIDKKKMIEQFDLPETQKMWDDAQKAMLEFDKKDQYDFSFGKWSVAARPIRAKEACLKCHSGDVATLPGQIDLEAAMRKTGAAAPAPTPPKVGDALGVAMYAYARKQKGASTLIR